MLLAACAASAAAISEPNLGEPLAFFSSIEIDHGGNSTGILFASALLTLSWLRRGPTVLGGAALLSLGTITGFGI
ncbi:MAG: hypothetical protein AB8G17_13905 [Gammaproteobacteria bacterium]